ncbi:MAG: type I restriction-modification system subunit M [Holosporales bacterium]|jgi:type I restriction enzyme M protein|nr:type I restriction-modification system subunit M [Holosporales bacterium]
MDKKEQERKTLHTTIWRIANELRGSIDGWDFKQYVLGMLFYRFISENLSYYINEKQAGKSDYAKLEDERAKLDCKNILVEKGFFIYPSELFENVRSKAISDINDLNETLDRVFKNIENSAKGTSSENNIVGLFSDVDVNSSKLGETVEKRNKLLIKIINAIGDLSLGNFSDNAIDVFGDAYEYLMTMYAANAGKSGGEFFTPQEVSELLVRIASVGKKRFGKVYDPCCGSGSLLLKFVKVFGKDNVKFYGQEKNMTTYNLCRINMFLHDVNYTDFNIALGDTLTEPKHKDDKPFDAIVFNPPYSIKWDGDSNPILINDERFTPAGVLAPKSKADFAFVMHALSWLARDGVAAIVCYPGIMHRSIEQKIRKYLIENNFVDCVIQLPKDLFFGTSTATSVLVLKKNKDKNKTLFIDASAEFVRRSTKNKLTEENIEKILDCFTKRETIEYFSKLVDNDEIVRNNYDYSVGTYVAKKDTREIVDIAKLNAEIDGIVARENVLRSGIDAIVADLEENKR